jgi:hypothetical protein
MYLNPVKHGFDGSLHRRRVLVPSKGLPTDSSIARDEWLAVTNEGGNNCSSDIVRAGSWLGALP